MEPNGAGKTTTSALLQPLLSGSRVFDAEKVGETLMDIRPRLPETDNLQHWPPWRPLVVETARRVLEYIGGTLIIPMNVLVEPYSREISAGLAEHIIPGRHFVLHADVDTLRLRIEGEHATPGRDHRSVRITKPVPEPPNLATERRGNCDVWVQVFRTFLQAAGSVVARDRDLRLDGA